MLKSICLFSNITIHVKKEKKSNICKKKKEKNTGVGAGVGGVKHRKLADSLASHPVSSVFVQNGHVSLV